jgi:hypothetical protein
VTAVDLVPGTAGLLGTVSTALGTPVRTLAGDARAMPLTAATGLPQPPAVVVLGRGPDPAHQTATRPPLIAPLRPHEQLSTAWAGGAAAELERARRAGDEAPDVIDAESTSQMAAPGLQEPAKKALARLYRACSSGR